MSMNRATSAAIPRRFRVLACLLLCAPALTFAEAQLSDAKVEALVEALRMAAPPAAPNSGLYGDWRVKPENIALWTKRCLNQEIKPEQFAADQALSRPTLVCVMGPVLREQFARNNNNEMVAVQRAAAWWLTGDATQYRTGATGEYTLRVLEAYLRFF